MLTISYTTEDKSSWGPGPWQQEPDKRQWEDPSTGLPCLIVRGPVGGLCGYVGVSPGHPLHGKSYSECVWPEKHDADERQPGAWHYNCTPKAAISVHGGLTYARGCNDLSEDAYDACLAGIHKAREEALRYPQGDSACFLLRWTPYLRSYLDWRAFAQATSICHIAPGEDRIWWFGFDCSHAGDYSPTHGRQDHNPDDIYREWAYVESEVRSLAAQLAKLR